MTGWYSEDPRGEPEPAMCRCGHEEGDHTDTAHPYEDGICCDHLDCECAGFSNICDPDPDEAYGAWLDDQLDYAGADA